MKIKDKIMMDLQELYDHGPINVVIFGDSVSHAAFNGYIDFEHVYWHLLQKKLNAFRTYVPVNMICTAIGGTTAKLSLDRLERQVLVHQPDLVIVCFGLNDVNFALEDYLEPLRAIFRKCKNAGSDVIFMTPNMLNTSVAEDTPEEYYSYAIQTAEMQNSGKMDLYMRSAVEVAREEGVTVCDCYAKWKELAKTQDITMLLANRINHPTPEMHELFANELFNTIMGDADNTEQAPSTMIQKENKE